MEKIKLVKNVISTVCTYKNRNHLTFLKELFDKRIEHDQTTKRRRSLSDRRKICSSMNRHICHLPYSQGQINQNQCSHTWPAREKNIYVSDRIGKKGQLMKCSSRQNTWPSQVERNLAFQFLYRKWSSSRFIKVTALFPFLHVLRGTRPSDT